MGTADANINLGASTSTNKRRNKVSGKTKIGLDGFVPPKRLPDQPWPEWKKAIVEAQTAFLKKKNPGFDQPQLDPASDVWNDRVGDPLPSTSDRPVRDSSIVRTRQQDGLTDAERAEARKSRFTETTATTTTTMSTTTTAAATSASAEQTLPKTSPVVTPST